MDYRKRLKKKSGIMQHSKTRLCDRQREVATYPYTVLVFVKCCVG